MKEATTSRGRRGEERAVAALRRLGYKILARNVRTRAGEIDVVARDGDTLVFVEVRLRQSDGRGSALETVTRDKQRRIARAAATYLAELPQRRRNFATCRFDVIGITGEELVHIQDAFRLGL